MDQAGSDDLGGFHRTYGVELLYVKPPALPKDALLAALRRRSPSAAPLDEDGKAGLLAFVHPDHMVELQDARIPAQTFIAVLEKAPAAEAIESALQQSWNFAEARQVVAACTASVLVTDLMSSSLPYKERLDLFSRSLMAVIETARPDAIHWRPTQQIVDPETWMRAAAESDTARFFAGAVNVRFFNISGSDGDMLMDTVGLAALGLPDLQCHFRGLEPDAIARLLHNLALYLFENGDVIENGHTVGGVEAGSKWRCQHEVALVDPDRDVIDIDPGEPWAAGSRDR